MTSGKGLGWAAVGAWLSVACVPPLQRAQSTFSADFNCSEATAEKTVAENRYRVTGCGHTASYECFVNGTCQLQLIGRDSPTAPGGSPDSARAKGSQKLAGITRTDTKSEGALMKLELPLEPPALLRLTATPDKEQNFVQLKLVREEETGATAECSLDFMVNGQVLSMPKSVASRTGTAQSHRVRIGRALIEEFGSANKIALRVCKERWSLTGEQVLRVRDFMDKFQEEIAWKAPPRSGGSGGMMPPSGGWPEWKASASALPPAATGAPLDGSALFKKLAPSVFVVEAVTADGTAQGSAVAVSQTELLTNCHVVKGALKITLKQAKQSWPARVVRADPKTDRCALSAEGTALTPVVGVRRYSSLEIGEPAYTLGTPVGLELTLSNGLVSGQREEDGRSFVQTTAPISPGSSGGGLFDARGNLIGITTLALVGKERLNQSLNFAIPAEFYFDSAAGKAQL